MNRYRQLDALRGLAVLLVVLHHWTRWGHALGLGNVGVQLFFVLSGFLITRILLQERAHLIRGENDLRGILLHFWGRRIARIWPVMFLTIGLVAVSGDRFEEPSAMAWHAGFLSNALFFARGEFTGSLAHFWTLAVEQQFYLIWPLIVLLVPEKWLDIVILLLVGAAPLTRLALHSAGFTDFAQYNTLPLANSDSLGLGGLAALWSLRNREGGGGYLGFAAIIATVLLLVERIAFPMPANMQQSLLAIVFSWMVLSIVKDDRRLYWRMLNFIPLVFIGTISYGMYVYHVFAPRAVGMVLRALDAPSFLTREGAVFVFSLAATILLAAGSWRFIEKPVIEWNRKTWPVSRRWRSGAALGDRP